MANFSQVARTRLSFKSETVLGTTPATPVFTEVPFVKSSLNATKTIIKSNAINSSRRVKFSRHGNIAVAGSTEFELSYAQYDELIAAAMLGAWTTNVCRIATTRTSFTIEEAALDISRFRDFKGMVPNTMKISVGQDSIIGLEFGWVGTDMILGIATLATTTTAALAAATPMVHKEGSISIGGSVVANVTSFELNVENGFTPAYAVGFGTAQDLSYGDASVTGSVSLYFQDSVDYQRFLSETSTTISLVCQAPNGNKYTMLMNNCVFNTANMDVSGSGPRTITMEFEALDDATASPLQITRAPS